MALTSASVFHDWLEKRKAISARDMPAIRAAVDQIKQEQDVLVRVLGAAAIRKIPAHVARVRLELQSQAGALAEILQKLDDRDTESGGQVVEIGSRRGDS